MTATQNSPTLSSVEIVGARFRITDSDGHVLSDDELVGAVLTVADEAGHPLTVRIDGHERDPRDSNGATELYALSTPDPANGGWQPLCGPDPEGRRLGFPLPGGWTETGEHVRADGFSVICTGGAIGKCVRFGYRPWATGPDGRPLWDMHQACVRMVRADYCGDGVGHTRNGTPIDLYDRLTIQRDEAAPGMSFEAAWTPSGASCVRHVRINDLPCPHYVRRRRSRPASACARASLPPEPAELAPRTLRIHPRRLAVRQKILLNPRTEPSASPIDSIRVLFLAVSADIGAEHFGGADGADCRGLRLRDTGSGQDAPRRSGWQLGGAGGQQDEAVLEG